MASISPAACSAKPRKKSASTAWTTSKSSRPTPSPSPSPRRRLGASPSPAFPRLGLLVTPGALGLSPGGADILVCLEFSCGGAFLPLPSPFDPCRQSCHVPLVYHSHHPQLSNCFPTL